MVSVTFFCCSLIKFLLDSSTQKNDFSSWVALLVILILWPLLLPISSWELHKKSAIVHE